MSHPPSLPPSAHRRKSPPPSPAEIWVAWGIDLLIVLVGFISISVVWAFLWFLWRTVQTGSAFNQPGNMGILSQMLMTILAIGLPTLMLCVWRHWPTRAQWRASFHAMTRPATWGWVCLIAASCLGFSWHLSQLGEQLGLSEASNVDMLKQGWINHPFVTAMMVVVLAPIYEELLFRRVLFRRLWQAGHPLLGMIVTGFLFAFVHEIPGTTNNGFFGTLWMWFIYTNLGIAFAWIYQHTGTLAASIAAHALNNAVALTALVISLL